MADRISRVGRVSSVNYKEGTIKVTYPALDKSVTDDLPVLCLSGEYKMPKVGEEVLVLHLSNEMEAGVVLGAFWGVENMPAESGASLFRKELASEAGEAYLRYKDKVAELKGPESKLTCSSGSVTCSQILQLIRRVEVLESYH